MKNISSKLHYGFLGAGKMAQAIVKGLLNCGVIGCKQITLTDCSEDAFKDSNKYHVEYILSNSTMIEKSDVIFICVKPKFVQSVLNNTNLFAEKLVVSIVAGVPISFFEKIMPAKTKVIRVVPNTPCLVKQGAAVFSCGSHITQSDIDHLRHLMQGIFPLFEDIPEDLVNAASALSGSGPAYIFTVIEALADGGTRMGLSRELSYKLATQTVLGSAQMVKDTEIHPALLREQVCSPGGSTLAGLHHLEKASIRAVFVDAIEAAKKRNDELAFI